MMNRSTNTRKRSTTIMYVALVILAVVAAYLLLSESDVDTANQPYDQAVLALGDVPISVEIRGAGVAG